MASGNVVTPGGALSNNTNLAELIGEVTQLRINTDKEMLTALTELSRFPDHLIFTADPRSRRQGQEPNLRSLIEAQQISSYKKFLISFKEVKDGVKALEGELNSLHEVCNGMSSNLAASKQNSRNLIDEIAKLEIERKKLEKERVLALAYQNAFQLNAEDMKILRGSEPGSNETLSPEFFAVFDKIHRIQANVSVLMKIGHQTTAVEIMDQMGLYQETALEKIYRWAQSRCRHIENPEIAEVLGKALSYLQIRPMLLKYVVDEYCNYRRSLVVRSFIDALTGVGNIKGIELIGSIDPVRYIGDMLAWIHQAIPGEKENLLLLLKDCKKEDLDEKLQTCFATILDGVCRPLNVRVEQTMLAGYDCIIVNKISLLLKFYIETIEQIVPGSNLLNTLRELQNLAHQTFINQLKSQVQAELGEFRPPSSDLTPPSVIGCLTSLLKDLIEPNATPEHTQTIVAMIVTPLVSQVNEAANRLGSPDQGVYLINCINEIIKFLQTFPETDMLQKQLQGQIDSQCDRLSAEQSSWLIAQLGIGHIYTILHEKIEDPLSSVPGMDPSSLKIFVNKLDTLISNPESVLLPQLIHIGDQSTRKMIQRQSFRILIAIYTQVHEAVLNPKNQYPENLLVMDPSTIESSLCS